jgi:hypothetical protein
VVWLHIAGSWAASSTPPRDLVGQGGHVGAGRGLSLEHEDDAGWLTFFRDVIACGLSGWLRPEACDPGVPASRSQDTR